ncbi:MFS transporter [Streptomyces sp. NPDC056580]|uniref:MFS transporter n=1 Tax=Streptomyces sp. NPDC056580 TaxID=3345872 RepID=UPI003690072F
MRKYLDVLRIADFRRLWTGSTLSLLGDGASWTAMAWLAVTHGGAASLSLLGLCYTAPILVGGVLGGAVVDRFSRRALLIVDSLCRGVAMGAVPLLALSGLFHLWQLYAAAAVCGLFKILPIAITPAVVPELVPQDRLATGTALETIAQGVASLTGPAIGGALIPLLGAQAVLVLDAATFLAFPLFVLRMDHRLPRPSGTADERSRSSWVPVVRLVLRDRALLVITIAFSALNTAAGMLMVMQPWLAHDRLRDGAGVLGLLVAGLAAAELLGSFAGGTLNASARPMLRIGACQLLAGTGLLLFLGGHLPAILAGQLVFGVGSALATVSSQVVRYARTPPALLARTMTLMRTLMLGAIPLGSLLAGPLLAGQRYTATVLVMVAITVVPGLLMCAVRLPALPTTPPRPSASAEEHLVEG